MQLNSIGHPNVSVGAKTKLFPRSYLRWKIDYYQRCDIISDIIN